MLENQISEKRDPDLNEKDDIVLDTLREDHWRDVAYEGDDKKNIYTLKW